jgi:hypothetical protein
MASIVERSQSLKREDLSNLMTYVDARSCPFTSAVKKGSAPKNSLLEWPLDKHKQNVVAAATYGTGAISSNTVSAELPIDGDDVSTFENYDDRTKATVYVQYLRRQPKVSRLANMTSDVAGVGWKKEMAESISKALVAHKRDIESTICSGQETNAEAVSGGSSEPYQTRGIGKWVNSSAGAILPVPADFRTPAASMVSIAAASLYEETVRGVLESIYNQTGEANKSFYGLCGTAVKKQLSELTLYVPSSRTGNIVASNRDAGASKLSTAVDIIESDFGTISLHLSTFLDQDARSGGSFDATVGQKALYILNLSNLELAFAENTNVRELPDQGGGPRSLIESVFALKSYSGGLDHGKIQLA